MGGERRDPHLSLVLGGWVGLFAHGEGRGDGRRLGAGARLAPWPGIVLGLVAYGSIGTIPET